MENAHCCRAGAVGYWRCRLSRSFPPDVAAWMFQTCRKDEGIRWRNSQIPAPLPPHTPGCWHWLLSWLLTFPCLDFTSYNYFWSPDVVIQHLSCFEFCVSESFWLLGTEPTAKAWILMIWSPKSLRRVPSLASGSPIQVSWQPGEWSVWRCYFGTFVGIGRWPWQCMVFFF